MMIWLEGSEYRDTGAQIMFIVGDLPRPPAERRFRKYKIKILMTQPVPVYRRENRS